MTLPLRNADALYIASEWVKPASGAKEPVINPATEEVIGEAPVGGKREVDFALQAARDAFDKGPWPRMKPKERAAKLQALHDGLMRRAAEICELIIAEAGATRVLTQFLQFGIPMQHFQYFIDAVISRNFATSLPAELSPNAMGTKTLGMGVKVYEPVGVVSAITPYNFPYFLNLGKIGPALAAGNTVVLKPSPYTPFQALIIAEAADDVRLPKGVLNIVTGGTDVGEGLTTDARVDLISFTGSDLVGSAIMGQAAPGLKRVLLELGGKSALIVRQDANLQQAAAAGLASFTIHAGQGCALTTRHLVHNSVRAKYVEMLAAMAKQIKVGNPADPQTGMGPLIREAQRQRVEHYVELGLKGGAKLVAGGRRPEGLEKGFFYEPTLFDNIDNKSSIAQDEIFGPVGVVIGYDSDEEAIALANDSRFGLSGAIFSADAGRAYEIALELRTGGVSINGGSGKMSSHAPFGGIKRSGIGREYGEEGLNEYMQLKTISVHAG